MAGGASRRGLSGSGLAWSGRRGEARNGWDVLAWLVAVRPSRLGKAGKVR